MLTKEQWQDAARFADIVVFAIEDDCIITVDDEGYEDIWLPDTDWNDFGPLWVKLERWLAKAFGVQLNNIIASLELQFKRAIDTGTDAEIMQAGLLLAAAIGKTMREGK